MRSLIFLSALIILCGLGYIGFSMLTYEPETIRRYNVSNINNTNQEYTEEENRELSSTNQKKKDAIIAILKPAIELYSTELSNTPSQVRSLSLSILNAIKQGSLPILYPLSNHEPSTQSISYWHEYTTINSVSREVSQVPETADDDKISLAECNSGNEGFLLGDTGKNKLSCTKDTGTNVRFFLGGPGSDIIEAKGNAIINGGSGNDAIIAGSEFTMIFVEPNFGTDTVDVDCIKSKADIRDKNKNVIPWKYAFTHFIVFDSRVSKDNIVISDNSLEDTITGDKIVLRENCFNVVFLSEE